MGKYQASEKLNDFLKDIYLESWKAGTHPVLLTLCPCTLHHL